MIDFRFILTENCNANCTHCFNAGVRDSKKVMDVNTFKKFLDVINKENLSISPTIKLMGGEPSIHPDINEFIKGSLNSTDSVQLFSNGLNLNNIDKSLINKIGITFNSFTFDLKKFKKIKKLYKKFTYHIVITMDEDNNKRILDKSLEFLNEFKNPENEISFILSPDTGVNIFDKEIKKKYQEVFLKNFETLYKKLMYEGGVSITKDHNFPLCFYDENFIKLVEDSVILDNLNENILFKYFEGCCSNKGETCLISTDFDLFYCNQTRVKIQSLIKEDGSFYSYFEIKDIIKKAKKIKNSLVNERLECRECGSKDLCKMGCYYNTYKANYN